MARRGSKGGGRSGDIQARLGSLFQSALERLGSVREAVTQQAQEGKTQFDLALLRRRRKAALAEIGAVVSRLAEDGRLDEDELPELSGPLARLEEIDEQMNSTRRGGGGGPTDEEFDAWRRQADSDEDTDEEDEEYMSVHPERPSTRAASRPRFAQEARKAGPESKGDPDPVHPERPSTRAASRPRFAQEARGAGPESKGDPDDDARYRPVDEDDDDKPT